ncbi:TauD/TfdA family dioxygenase [Algihabitans albus]|uniref:TauD/TfdA family dioxygenase n=1 Tax=Algihabitans albus TaxID=2164067 RepID=UPI000E5D21BD|nr:TauD/TfdA family dioxygenase [Algihabitans albus]
MSQPQSASDRTGGRSAWVRSDIALDRVTLPVDAKVREEMLAVVAHLRHRPLPTILLSPSVFELPASRRLAAEIQRLLDGGPRFCLVDRLPVEEMTSDEAKACYWLLSSLVCRPVAQKLDGTMIYDVRDTGLKADPGSGVRPDKTNIDLTFHNDNAYNARMPEVVGLLCLKTARSGGRSRVMSFQTAHRALLERAPQVVPRLYEPFWFDRQREHRDDEDPTFAAPIFVDAAGEVQARLGLHQVRNAYAMRGEELDSEGRQAIDALQQVFADPDLQFDFAMEAGQVQFVHNLTVGHSRTQFEDFEAPERRRHLVRLWLRDSGDRSYPG